MKNTDKKVLCSQRMANKDSALSNLAHLYFYLVKAALLNMKVLSSHPNNHQL